MSSASPPGYVDDTFIIWPRVELPEGSGLALEHSDNCYHVFSYVNFPYGIHHANVLVSGRYKHYIFSLLPAIFNLSVEHKHSICAVVTTRVGESEFLH